MFGLSRIWLAGSHRLDIMKPRELTRGSTANGARQRHIKKHKKVAKTCTRWSRDPGIKVVSYLLLWVRWRLRPEAADWSMLPALPCNLRDFPAETDDSPDSAFRQVRGLVRKAPMTKRMPVLWTMSSVKGMDFFSDKSWTLVWCVSVTYYRCRCYIKVPLTKFTGMASAQNFVVISC